MPFIVTAVTAIAGAISGVLAAGGILKELGDFLFDWVMQNQTLQEQQIVQI